MTTKATISIAHNPVRHDKTKHVEIDRHFIEEKIDSGLICPLFVASKPQLADVSQREFRILNSTLWLANWEWKISLNYLKGECWNPIIVLDFMDFI